MKKILPPSYFTFCLIFTVLLHYTIPIKQIIIYPFNLLGFLFFLFGGVLNIWADQLFKKNKTTVKPDESPSVFIQTGPFRISRNPMYLGMTILLIGIVFILGSIISIAGFVLFIIVMEIVFIPEEEKVLREQFGVDYETYKMRVRRWI
jgi:protein-S-isoprenylcysteine O-methyltransferase Ste14